MRRNHIGYRVGEGHHRARMTDQEVRIARFLHTSAVAFGLTRGGPRAVGYGKIGEVLGASASTIRDVVTYRTRASA